MAESTTFERICDIIRDNGGTADMELTPETKLADAGLDSNPETVGEFVELVESLMEN